MQKVSDGAKFQRALLRRTNNLDFLRSSSKMARGVALIILLSSHLAFGAEQTVATPSQISNLWGASLALWHNETCGDLCSCVEGIMRALNAAQICMEVKGYPCHFVKQLMWAPSQQNCSVTIGGKWFECDKGSTECVGSGGEMSVDDETNCTSKNTSESGATNTAYLGCETTVGVNTSVTCVLSRDRDTMGQCVNKAECVYRKDTATMPRLTSAQRERAIGRLTAGDDPQAVAAASNVYVTTVNRLQQRFAASGVTDDRPRINKIDVIVEERVSCQEHWVPFRRHCLSPINGIMERDILDQKTWHGANKYCQRRWRASMLSITSFSGNEIRELKERGIFVTDQQVWLGLFRDTDNSSFHWVDNTTIMAAQEDWPWAVDHPKPTLNYVYMLNDALYSAHTNEVHRYSCKMRVSKTLKCRQPQPTEIPQTMKMNDASTNTQWTKKPKESLEALREELTQVRDEVSNYLKAFTDNPAVLDAIDDLISLSDSPINTSDAVTQSAEQQSTNIVRSLDSMVDGLAESIVGPAEPLVVSTPEIVLKVLTLCMICDEVESIGGQLGNQTFSVTLPDSVIAAGATLALSTASLLHEELPATIEGGDNPKDGETVRNEIGTLVSTISLRRWDGESIALTEDEPLQLTFSNLKKYPDFKPSCRYWKVSDGNEVGAWSSEGCTVGSASNDTHTVCNITHLTSFAVIMQISHYEDTLPVSLEYLTWAGSALSVTCLAIMLIVFLSQRMYRADRNIIHMNLAASLMLAQIIFVFGIDSTENEAVCKSVGICVHFFLLATFFWMLNEGIFLLSKTTSAKTRWLRLPTYFTIGWVFPLVIVVITVAASFGSYDTTNRCWLTVHDGGIYAFVGPAAAVISINICILLNVIRVFLSLKANMNKKKVERIRIALRAILLTLPLLGCTWLIGMMHFNSATLVFAYIFVILNSLQGVFIFILYCLLNDEIKKGLRKRLALLQSLSGRTTHTRASRTTTSGSNNHKTNRLSKTMQPDQEAAKL